MIRNALGRVACLLAVFVASCTSSAPLSIADENVRVTTAEADVEGCRSIRLVEARTQFGRADSEKNRTEIMKEMRRETAVLGGNVLYLRSGHKISGVAYSCDSAFRPRS